MAQRSVCAATIAVTRVARQAAIGRSDGIAEELTAGTLKPLPKPEGGERTRDESKAALDTIGASKPKKRTKK